MKIPRVILINDTSSYSNHFGCQLVCQSIREQISRTGLRLVGSFTKSFEIKDIVSLRPHFDLAIVNGEGTVHHGAGRTLVELAGSVPSVFINAVYQDNGNLPALDRFLYVALRESMSGEYVRNLGVECEVVPDAIFASHLLSAYAAQFRTQREMGLRQPRKMRALTDSVGKRSIDIGPLKIRVKNTNQDPFVKTPTEYLDYLVDHRTICTGRFHAVCSAAILGLPFSSWDSNTWKIQGITTDMGASNVHYKTEEEARKAIEPNAPLESVEDYVANARIQITQMFDKIASIARDIAAR